MSRPIAPISILALAFCRVGDFLRCGGFLCLWAAAGSVRSEPIITEHPRGLNVFPGASAVFRVRVADTNGVRFQWHLNSTVIPQAEQSEWVVPEVTPASVGDYSVVLRDAGGSVTSRVATLTLEVPRQLVPLTSPWKYWARAQPPADDWQQPDFAATSWTDGLSLFHREPSPLPLPRGTPLPIQDESGAPITAHYFRTEFTFEGNPEGLFLLATNYVDDGALFYLNGQEIGRLRVPDGPLIDAAPASPAKEGVGVVMRFPADALVPGRNILAVEVRQHADTDADVVFGMSLHTVRRPPPLPDLMPWAASARPWIEEATFQPGDCAIHEGCAAPGIRRLLRFTTETRNVGDARLSLGSPASNPEFVFDGCHLHYHFDDYIRYRLVDAAGNLVVEGGKRSFCLEDSDRWDLTSAAVQATFHCSGVAEQGIQAGWTDIYDSVLPCQYLDITDVAPGSYELELALDPGHRLSESSRSNNVVRVPVVIPANWIPCATPPDNDEFGAARVLPAEVTGYRANSSCATRQSSDPVFGGSPAFHSVWFRWVAPRTGRITIDSEGSHFTTLLGLYLGNTPEILQPVAIDNAGRGPGFSSRVVPEVTAGTEYRLCVASAYFGLANRAGSGEIVLNIRPTENDLFVAPELLQDARGSWIGHSAGAGREVGEPFHAGEPGGRSLWFAWTAPADAAVVFEALGGPVAPLLGVYRDAAITDLRPLGNPRESSLPHRQQLPIQVRAGERYRIAVDSRDAAAMDFELRWRPRLELRIELNPTGTTTELTVRGLAGDRYLLETSSDLEHWTAGEIHLLEVDEVNRELPVTTVPRFYRVRLP